MAYIYDPNLSDEENKKREEAARGDVIGGGGLIAGTQTPPSAGGAPSGLTQSGAFVPVARYVEQNKDQSKALAENVGEKVNASGRQAQEKLGAAEQQALGGIESSRVGLDKTLLEDVQKNPTAVAPDAVRRAAFQKMFNAEYKGPSGIDELADFKAAQELKKQYDQSAELAGTVGGRRELMASTMTPGAGKGLIRLNQVLLEQTPEARDIITAKQKALEGLGTEFETKQKSVADKAAAARAETEATRGAVRAGTVGALEQEMGARAEQLKKDRDAFNAEVARLRTELPGREKAGQVYDAGDTWDSVPDLYNAANVEDMARIKALEELTGQSLGYKSGFEYDTRALPSYKNALGNTIPTKPPQNYIPPPNPVPTNWTYYDDFGGSPRYKDQDGNLRYGDGSYWTPGMV